MLRELVPGLDEEPLELPRLVEPAGGGDLLAMICKQLGLVVERVDVRRASGRMQRKITCFARAGKCWGFTARGPPLAAGWAARAASAEKAR